MRPLSGVAPARGVRYVFELASQEGAAARYDVTVHTAEATGRARVAVDSDGARVEGEAEGLEAAHAAQLVALARTLAPREGEAWPRRAERWRSPGVR